MDTQIRENKCQGGVKDDKGRNTTRQQTGRADC